MTWDVEAHPSTVIADVPTISAGDRHLTTEGFIQASVSERRGIEAEAYCYLQ